MIPQNKVVTDAPQGQKKPNYCSRCNVHNGSFSFVRSSVIMHFTIDVFKCDGCKNETTLYVPTDKV